MFSFLRQGHDLILKLILTILFLNPCNLARAQHFQFRTYSFSNGLSSYNAGKIVQDNYGFIWICTQEGINRFDGKEFFTIKKDPLQNTGLSENYITDAAMDKTGKLWIATALGGIDVLNPENFKIEKRLSAGSPGKTSLITNWIRCLAWSAREELWIGTYYGLNVYNKYRNSFISFTENPFNKKHDLNICFAGMDSLKNMWLIAENDGAIVFNTVTKRIISTIRKEELGIKADEIFSVQGLFIDKSNGVYLCSNRGLKHVVFDNKKYVAADMEAGPLSKLNEMDVRTIVKDNNGRIWAGTANGMLVFDKTGNAEPLQHSNFFYNTILDDNVNYLFNDSFGNIWATTTRGLNLLINDRFHFQAFHSKSGILSEMKHINTLYPDNDSVIYACASNGLFKINIKDFSTTHVLKSDQYGEIESVIRVDQKGFLASSIQKLVYIKHRGDRYDFFTAADVFKELMPVRLNYFSTWLKLNDSVILMGSMEDEGFFKWNIKSHILKQFKNIPGNANTLHENNIHNIKVDRSGNVWLLSNSSITRYDPVSDLFKNYIPVINGSEKNLPHFFFDLYDDGKFLWITSYGSGLIRFDVMHNTFTAYTEKDGFSSNATYNILDENDSIAWVSSNKGLTRFNTLSGEASAYYFNDGLQSDAFDERSACKIGEYLFFGGIDGFTQISRNSLFTSSSRIPAYIGKVSFTHPSGRLVEINSLNSAGMEIRSKSGPITFRIISPDYSNGNRDYYAYKIEEQGGDWIQLGQKNEITLAGLPPGVYHFTGRIYNSDGYASESKSIEFTIAPQWYQTALFKVAIIAFITALLYIFYRSRISQLKKQQQIRRDIAGDLHDDIGSTLNSVKIYTHLLEISPDKQEYINQIKKSLKQASIGLRDMIWVLDDNQDIVEDLVNRIKQFALPLAAARNVTINFSAGGLNHIELKKTEKRNLLLILKEAINNSIKYANCKNINVLFQRVNGKITLVMEDDGCGFENNNITPGEGLKNIHQRAKQINYTSVIYSGKGAGTRIVLEAKD